MTTIIAVDGIDGSSNSIGFAPPVSLGLTAWFHMGGTSADTVRNRADAGPSGTIVGGVTFSTGYAGFTDQNTRLDTSILETEACTLLCVARSSAAFTSSSTRPILLGTFSSYASGIEGACVYVAGTGSAAPSATIHCSASRDSSGVPTMTPAVIEVADFSQWTFLAGVVKAGAVSGARAIYDMTNATSATATPATGRLFDPVKTVGFGNTTSLTYGQNNMAWAAHYNRDLTYAEIEKIYAFVKKRLADKFAIAI